LAQLVELLAQQTKMSNERSRPSLVDGKTVGKPTAFKGEENRFPEFAKKLEDYLISIEPRLEEALEWALEQDTEITVAMVDERFGSDAIDPIPHVASVNQQFKTVLSHLTEMEAYSIVQNCSRNGLEAWRRLHRRYDPITGGRRRNLLRAIMAPQRVKIEDLGAALETWEDMVSRYNKKNTRLKQAELPDDIKCSALEAMVPEELERHLQMNAARLSKYEDMRHEIVMFFETMTGKQLRVNVKNQMPGQGGASPMEVDALIAAAASLMKGGRKGKGKGNGKQSPDVQCTHCGKKGHKATDCWSRSPGGSGGKALGRDASQPKKFEGKCHVCGKIGHKAVDCRHKGKGKTKGDGKSKGKPGGKGLRALDDAGGEEPEREGAGLDLASIDAETLRKYTVDGFLKLNYDTGAAVSAFPEEFSEGGAPTGTTLVTASGERITDMGEIRLTTRDEYNQSRRISGKVTSVHKVLMSASCVNREGKQRAWLTDTGGYLIPRDGPIAKGMDKHLERLIEKYGAKSLLPLYVEKGVYNFYLKVDKSEAISSVSTVAVGSSAGSPASKQISAVNTAVGGSSVGSPASKPPFGRQARP